MIEPTHEVGVIRATSPSCDGNVVDYEPNSWANKIRALSPSSKVARFGS